MYKVLTLQTDGSYTLVTQARKPDLDQLQKGVDGMIEPVDNFIRGKHITAYMNEEGIILNMNPNRYAMLFCQWPGFLVGPMVAYWKETTKRAAAHTDKFFEDHGIYLADLTELEV